MFSKLFGTVELLCIGFTCSFCEVNTLSEYKVITRSCIDSTLCSFYRLVTKVKVRCLFNFQRCSYRNQAPKSNQKKEINEVEKKKENINPEEIAVLEAEVAKQVCF